MKTVFSNSTVVRCFNFLPLCYYSVEIMTLKLWICVDTSTSIVKRPYLIVFFIPLIAPWWFQRDKHHKAEVLISTQNYGLTHAKRFLGLFADFFFSHEKRLKLVQLILQQNTCFLSKANVTTTLLILRYSWRNFDQTRTWSCHGGLINKELQLFFRDFYWFVLIFLFIY